MLANSVAGIIIVPARDIESGLNYDKLKIHHINIVRKGMLNTKTYFTVDSFKSGTLVANHFVKLNRKHPAYIGYSLAVSCNRLRFHGYRDTLLENSIRLRADHVYSCLSNPQDAYKAAKHLLKEKKDVDSIFVYNDQMAFGVVKALLDLGIKIPEDITVVGHDDIEEAAFFSPALSTVNIPKYRLGYECAVSLIEMIQSRETNEKSVIYVPKLLIRET